MQRQSSAFYSLVSSAFTDSPCALVRERSHTGLAGDIEARMYLLGTTLQRRERTTPPPDADVWVYLLSGKTRHVPCGILKSTQAGASVASEP